MFLDYIVMQSSAAVKQKIKNLPFKKGGAKNQSTNCCSLLRFAALIPAVCGKNQKRVCTGCQFSTANAAVASSVYHSTANATGAPLGSKLQLHKQCKDRQVQQVDGRVPPPTGQSAPAAEGSHKRRRGGNADQIKRRCGIPAGRRPHSLHRGTARHCCPRSSPSKRPG